MHRAAALSVQELLPLCSGGALRQARAQRGAGTPGTEQDGGKIASAPGQARAPYPPPKAGAWPWSQKRTTASAQAPGSREAWVSLADQWTAPRAECKACG